VRLFSLANVILLCVLTGCPDINSPVDDVSIGFTPAERTLGFLSVGDSETVHAQATIRGWPPIVKYDSRTAPTEFRYFSTDAVVAQIDRNGVIHAISPGTTDLVAAAEGVKSRPVTLTVSQPAAKLLAEPAVVSAVVADLVTISVTAEDVHGGPVTGIPFTIGPDTTWWAVVSPPEEGSWNLRTPAVIHMRAKMAGRVNLLATTLHDRSAESLAALPVSVRIRNP
jgi:hypothetical protein